MATVDPYRSPKAAVADAAVEYQDVRLFAVSGRIGRLRYIAYSIGVAFLAMFGIGILVGLAGAAGVAAVGGVLTVAAWVIIVVLQIMLTIQRCHDFNATGWLAILWLIPLVNLVFWFIPGTDGENRFGSPTAPNSVLTVIAALILPIVFVVGILAAIAIPAYQDYVKRAQTLEQRR